MPRRPWSGGTRLFSSADESDSSSDTSSDELWVHTSPGVGNANYRGGRGGGGGGGAGDDGDMALKTLPTMAAALRASRARASAALSKASRLQEETGRLRDALKVARKDADRAGRFESDLTKSEMRVRELESCKRQLRRDLEGVKIRTSKVEVKARQSLSTLRVALKEVEERERSRCRRWRATTRSLRALLESLRRHVQRGHHPTPSFTAFQLIEQLFDCLKKQEADARLPPHQPATAPSSPVTPPEVVVDNDDIRDTGASATTTNGKRSGLTKAAGKINNTDAGEREHGEHVVVGGGGGRPYSSLRRRSCSDNSSPRVLNQGTGTDLPLSEEPKRASLLRKAVVHILGTPDGVEETPSLEAFSPSGDGRIFSTEWAYRLAVTKLTAQLKAARERLRGEKEAARGSGERADQEELRCRQLELEVKGLSSKVAGAERHRVRLETMLKESQRDRDLLKQRRQRGAPNHALNAALGIAQRRGASVPLPVPPSAAAAIAPTAATAAAAAAAAATVAATRETGDTTLHGHRYGFGNSTNPGTPETAGGKQELRAGGIHPDGAAFVATGARWGDSLRPSAPASSSPPPLPPLPPGDGDQGAGDAGDVARTRTGGLKTKPEYSNNNNSSGRASGLDMREEGYRYMNSSRRRYTTSSSTPRGGKGGRGVAPTATAREGGVKSSLTGFCKVGDGWKLNPPGVRKDGYYHSAGRKASGLVAGAATEGGFGHGVGRRARAATAVGGSEASWGLGPRAVTREDLTRLDDEIANLSKTVEEAAMAQTRQILRNVADSVERPKETAGGGSSSRRRRPRD